MKYIMHSESIFLSIIASAWPSEAHKEAANSFRILKIKLRPTRAWQEKQQMNSSWMCVGVCAGVCVWTVDNGKDC